MHFSIKDVLHNKVRDLLLLETDPGLGCTDPAAVGLCAAGAVSLLEKDVPIESISVTTDPNIFKNAMGVIIPASEGKCGIPLAAAMGAVAGDPGNGLQIFTTVDKEGLEKALNLENEGKVKAEIEDRQTGLYIRVAVEAGGQNAVAVISGKHDSFESLTLDGSSIVDHALLRSGKGDEVDTEEFEHWLISLTIGEMVAILDDLDTNDITYIKQGIELNMKLVDYGLSCGPGLGIGKTQVSLIRQGLLRKDMALMAGITAAAGIDARMGGAMLPAMTLGGSGNQGIAAGTPIAAVADFAMCGDDGALMVKSVMLSYLITCRIKAHTGRMSAICGSGVASGAGVAAGVTYLLGGPVEKIGGGVMNHVETCAMLLCDGAKTGCALKVGEAASSAVKSALMALQGTIVTSTDGIIDRTPEKTMANLGDLSQKGLEKMDATILDIMLSKCL
jgi:L-cysteine desulfidase